MSFTPLPGKKEVQLRPPSKKNMYEPKEGLEHVSSAKAAPTRQGGGGRSWSVPRVGYINKEVVNPASEASKGFTTLYLAGQ